MSKRTKSAWMDGFLYASAGRGDTRYMSMRGRVCTLLILSYKWWGIGQLLCNLSNCLLIYASECYSSKTASLRSACC